MPGDYTEEVVLRIADAVGDWRDAVATAVAPLCERGYVDKGYDAHLIESIERCGRGFAVSPYAVLPYAESAGTAHGDAVSVLLVKRPVYFCESSMPIKIVVALAATSVHAHLRMLRRISSVLDDGERVHAAIRSTSAAELRRHLMGGCPPNGTREEVRQ